MVRKKIYKTNKGANIDMEAMRTVNEKTIAAGNMSVNAKGDIVQGGKIIKTAKERAKERYVAPKRVAQAGLKQPLSQTESKVNPEVKPEPIPIPEAEITTETIRTREDGSRYSETMGPEGDIEVKEISEPTKKVTKKKKKASTKTKPSV